MAVTFYEANEEFIEKMNKFRQAPSGMSLFSVCSESPVLFAELMLGIRPYAWQVQELLKWSDSLKDRGKKDNKEHLVLSSRQVGKTTAVALFALWATVFNKYPYGIGNSTNVGIISASEDQATMLLYEIKKMMMLGDVFMSTRYLKDGKPVYGTSFFTDLLDKGAANNTEKISFQKFQQKHGQHILKDSKLGSVLASYPPTTVVLGKTFSIVLIDEAGKTEKVTDRAFYDYIYPTGNAANALRIYTSTPWEPTGFFYERVDPEATFKSPATASAYTIDVIKQENPDYYSTVKKIIDDMVNAGKLDEVNRAYYCAFVKGDLAYFDPLNVNKMFTQTYTITPTYRGQCDMGVDFGGKTTSRTVITISELTEKGMIRRLYKKVYPVGKDDSLLEDIAQLLKDFNVQRIIPDDCPQGAYLIEDMKRLGWNVHPMVFRTDKVKKYGAFRAQLNAGKVESFVDDTLKTEMLAMQFNNGARNSVINHAPGYTDDEIDSFVMSTYFYLEEEPGVQFYEF